jgi:hypothetical protein
VDIRLTRLTRYRTGLVCLFPRLVYLFEPQTIIIRPGTHGVRKLRWSRAGMGKRSGVWVLYYAQDSLGRIWLLTVYAKGARENIATSTLNTLRDIAGNAEII